MQIVLSAEPLFPKHIRGNALIMVGHAPINLKYMKDELYPYLAKRLEKAKICFKKIVYLEPNYHTYMQIKTNSATFSDVIKLVGSPYFDKNATTRETFNLNKLNTKDKKYKVLIQSTWSHSLIEENHEFLCKELTKIFPHYNFYFSLHPLHFYGPYSKKRPYGELIMKHSQEIANLHLVSDSCDKNAFVNDMDYIISDHTGLVVLGEFWKKKLLIFYPSFGGYDSKTLKKVCQNAVHVETQKELKSSILTFLNKTADSKLPYKSYNFIRDYKQRVNDVFVEVTSLCKKG